MKKILVVSPVPTYATWDVFTGQSQGLKAAGAEVLPFNYSKVWNMYADFKEFMEVTGRAQYNTINHTAMAGDRLLGAAIINEVDLVHFVAPMHINPVTLKVFKQYTNIKTSAYFTECPYDDTWTLRLAELFDFCFVCDKTSVETFRAQNKNTYYIGHAYNPERHVPKKKEDKDADVVFVGTNFPSRLTFLRDVDWTDIDLHLHGLMRLGKSPLSEFVKSTKPMPNEEALNIYRHARIGLQIHRKDGFNPEDAKKGKRIKGGIVGATPIENFVAHSLGPRSYELAACGVFQVSDAERPELAEVFGDSVPVYSTPENLGVLLRTYLDDPVRREEAAAKQLEAVQPYTFEYRMRGLLDAVA